jgi:hypothetical protein
MTEGGREVKVPLEKLSKADQAAVRRIAEISSRVAAAKENAKDAKPQASQPQRGLRETQLAELDKKREQAIADQKRKTNSDKSELAKITSKLARLKRATRTDSLAQTIDTLERRKVELDESIQGSQSELNRLEANCIQDQRRIVRQYPKPGDPWYTEYDGRLYTAQELEKYKALQANHGSPQVAANRYMQSQISSGRINKATFLNVSHNGCRVNYQVEYTSEAGFVMTRNGCIPMVSIDGLWYVHPTMLVTGGVVFEGFP